MTPEEKIEVIRAQAAGKTLQTMPLRNAHTASSRFPTGEYGVWTDVVKPNPDFNFSYYDYRVKPEPREWEVIAAALDNSGIYRAMFPNAPTITVREVL